jgi:hypothetical protein
MTSARAIVLPAGNIIKNAKTAASNRTPAPIYAKRRFPIAETAFAKADDNFVSLV